jgi:hypothetical protein
VGADVCRAVQQSLAFVAQTQLAATVIAWTDDAQVDDQGFDVKLRRPEHRVGQSAEEFVEAPRAVGRTAGGAGGTV